MPPVRGGLVKDAPLSRHCWFRTGGVADWLFDPADEADLMTFLAHKDPVMPVTVIGVGSNLLVRDGGVRGVVIRLGKIFADITVTGDLISAGAGAMDVHVARRAADAGVGGLEFLVGVPGTIGGALRMNAGAYGAEVADVFVAAHGINETGEGVELSATDMGFSYRRTALSTPVIFTRATFRGGRRAPAAIKAAMKQIMVERETSQPIGTRTGGSTFKNPDPASSAGRSAWQLIDEAGCRGLRQGGTGVSEKHCNFLINYGDATASDIETLGEMVRAKVFEKTGVELQWEIRLIGEVSEGQE